MQTLSTLNGGGEGLSLLMIGGAILFVAILSKAKAEWIMVALFIAVLASAGMEAVFAFVAKNFIALAIAVALIALSYRFRLGGQKNQ